MKLRASAIDGLLVLMVCIWGVNYSVIKRAFSEIAPLPFNALRLALGAVVFLAAIRYVRRHVRTRSGPLPLALYTPHALTSRDRWHLVWLGLVGHSAYQLLFAYGIAATTVSNGALIIGTTPVAVAVISAALGRERISGLHWAGAAVSVLGIYLVVGRGASFGGTTLKGDLLMIASVGCWAAYTLGSSRLMTRHSPLYVTGTTMAIGAVPYGLLAIPQLRRLPWGEVSGWTWTALVFSALLALNVAYLIWYISVQRLGPARTSIYSNVVPIVAIGVATVWLGEPLTRSSVLGAAAVLTGVFLTRVVRQ